MPARLQFVAQLFVVVDLPVENDRNGAIFVEDRLIAGLEVDDAEPPHAESNLVAEVKALGIRPAVPHRVAHSVDQRAVCVRAGALRRDPGYATHADVPQSIAARRLGSVGNASLTRSIRGM